MATCNYGDKRDELLRNRIIVGISEKQLSEELQRDDKLTLEKAVMLVRQAEQIQQQQWQLHAPAPQQLVNAVTSKQPGSGSKKKFSPAHQKNKGQPARPTTAYMPWSGKQRHDRRQCPTRDVDCRKYGKHGHFGKMCKSWTDKAMHAVEDNIGFLFLSSVNILTGKKLWLIKLLVNGRQMEFCIDTGADTTCISADSLDCLIVYHLQTSVSLPDNA